MATTPITSLTAGSVLAATDVVVYVDVSDTSQAPTGTTKKLTVTNLFALVPVPVVVTSASANALAVGRLGATTPAFQVDASTASQVAGLKVTGAATGGTVAIVAIDSGSNTNVTVNAKGSGTIGIGSVSTGRVTITPVTTITGLLTLSGGATSTGLITGDAGSGNASFKVNNASFAAYFDAVGPTEVARLQAITGVFGIRLQAAGQSCAVYASDGNPIVTFNDTSKTTVFAGTVKAPTTVGVGNATPASSGAGITFPAVQSASTDVNTLDDYEEGDWTPSIGGDATYTTQYGRYQKVGKWVRVVGAIQVNVRGTGSTGTVSGLPFTSANFIQVGQVGYFSTSSVNSAWMSLSIAAGATSFTIIGQGAIDGSTETITPIQDSFLFYFNAYYEASA